MRTAHQKKQVQPATGLEVYIWTKSQIRDLQLDKQHPNNRDQEIANWPPCLNNHNQCSEPPGEHQVNENNFFYSTHFIFKEF